jgi:hypothetical protein
MSRNDKRALAQAMGEWPQRVVNGGVRTETHVYRPVSRNVTPLRYLDDPDRLLAEMRHILDSEGWDSADTGSSGWNRIMEQAGPDYLWEWMIMDRTTPWADLFTDENRWKVAVAVAHTLRRGL